MRSFYFNSKKSLESLLIVFLIISAFFVTSIAFATEKSLVYINAKAYSLYIKGDYNSSLVMYKRAINLHPKYAPFYDGLANIYMKQKNYGQAYLNFKAASNLDSSNSIYKIHSQEAIYKAYISKIQSAKSLYSKALSFSQNNNTIRSNFENLNDNDFQNFVPIRDLYRDNSDYYLTQGNIAFQNGKYSSAINLYEKSARLKRRNYKAYSNIGYAYSQLDKNNNSLIYYNKAIKFNSSAFHAYNNIGVIYLKKKAYSQAEKYFNLALKYNGSYSSAYNNKAICKISDIPLTLWKSIKYLKTIIEKDPDNISAAQLLGLFYALNNDYNNAAITYKSVFDLVKDNNGFIKTMGGFYLQANQPDETVFILKNLINNGVESSDIYLSLAKAYEKKQDKKNAFYSYQTAIKLDFDNAEAYKYFGKFLLSENREAEAKAIFRKYLDNFPKDNDYYLIAFLIK